MKISLWHAFDVMDETSQVKKTRVRVLTNNIGQILKVEHAETIWDKVQEELIDFDLFIRVLKTNLLVGVEKNTDSSYASFRAELDHLCWMLCEKSYLQRINAKTSSSDKDSDTKRREFTATDLFRLWKIFNFLCERAEDNSVLIPLRLDIAEAGRIVSEIRTCIGLPVYKASMLSPETSFLLDFCEFIKYLAERLGSEEEAENISHGVAEIHSQIISDVVRKGYLIKFGNKVTAWKERWFVLTASALRYFTTSEEKDLKGSIVLCAECFTQSFPDKGGGKHHRFKLHTPGKQYELCASDLKTKNEWMSDLKRVVNSVGTKKESLQRQAWKERKKSREEKRRRTAEEELRRCEEREKLADRERQLEEAKKQKDLAQAEIKERERLLELERQKRLEEEELRQKEISRLLEENTNAIEAERQRCAETEAKLKAEREELVKMNQEALEAERGERALVIEKLKEEEARMQEEKNSLMERLKELEEMKISLEAMVEEERALKKDEEIVRNLQSKILEEEFAKREELEKLQEEQKNQLLKEQLTRQELEEAHLHQQEVLKLKQDQLDALIKGREQADKNWQDAVSKLKQAEVDRQRLEERLKLKEMNSAAKLARPRPTADPNPFVTHRGLGAFVENDFHRNRPGHDTEMDSQDNENQYSSNGSIEDTAMKIQNIEVNGEHSPENVE